MHASRRTFVSHAAALTFMGTAAANAQTAPENTDQARGESGELSFTLHPIGKVEKDNESTRIRIFEKYAAGLLGLDQWSHVNVFYWFDKNDTPQQRGVLQVHPRGNRENPLTGVFACRAPVRPNLIALSVCKIVSVEQHVLTVDGIDAFDATPVIDLKPFIPPDAPNRDIKVPDWTGRGRRRE